MREEILQKAYNSIIEADEEMALDALEEGLAAKIDPVDMLNNGYSKGIQFLGDQFGRGEVFLPELIFATEAMKAVTDRIDALLLKEDRPKKAVMVIGTVEGDVHDIGKGIVASLVKASGVEVIDLGREVPAQVFVEKAKESNADFVGSSALLTTTMQVQKEIEEELIKAGLRDGVKTMVGGAPVTKRWAEKIGADAYCEDAADSVNYIEEWISNK